MCIHTYVSLSKDDTVILPLINFPQLTDLLHRSAEKFLPQSLLKGLSLPRLIIALDSVATSKLTTGFVSFVITSRIPLAYVNIEVGRYTILVVARDKPPPSVVVSSKNS